MKNLTKSFITIALAALTFTSCDTMKDVIRTGRTIEDVTERAPTGGSESETTFRSSPILWGPSPAI